MLLLCRLAVFHYRDCVKWTKASFVSTSNIFLCWICTYYSLINDSNLLLVMSLVLPISYLEMPLFQIDRPSVHIIYFQCITHSTDVTIAPLLCISLLSPIKWTEKWSFLKDLTKSGCGENLWTARLFNFVRNEHRCILIPTNMMSIH